MAVVDIDLYSNIEFSEGEEEEVTQESNDLFSHVLISPSSIAAGTDDFPSVEKEKDESGTDSKTEISLSVNETGIGTLKRPSHQLYVGNLTWWTSDQDIKDAVEDLGVSDLLQVRFHENRVNGQSKGFCCLFLGSESSLKRVHEKLPKKEIHSQGQSEASTEDEQIDLEEQDKNLHLKGQMMFMAEWNVIMFLCSPSLPDLETLSFSGLYINDLSMHDFSRDLLLANSQQSNELKDALDSEMKKTKEIEDSMRQLDIEMKRSDELLAQMIPKTVAEKVKSGLNPVETCEVFEQVTIVFNDIPGFLDICAKCDGMQIVQMLNDVFGIFDQLSDRNGVYKVETVKDSFVGVSGAPDRVKNHAEKIIDMALDMRDCVAYVHDPRPEFDGQPEAHVKIRLGSHSGQVVAGIVGNKMPRYCLFGDAMNTSSRMMSFGNEQMIHISDTTKQLLPPSFATKERGKINVKGKGEMTTFWVESKANRVTPNKDEILNNLKVNKDRPLTSSARNRS